MVWYSHLLNNFPQFVVIHTLKSFSIVNEVEVGVFLGFSYFFCDPTDVGNLISDFSAFSKSNLIICKFFVHILLKPATAAAAKLLRSCPILCDAIDSSHEAPPSLGFSGQEHC